MLKIESNTKSKLAELCREHKVTKLYLFGSALREDFNEIQSDLDLVVEFSEEVEVLDFAHNFFSFQFALEDLFGMPIDLICSNELKNPLLKSEVEGSKVELYAA